MNRDEIFALITTLLVFISAALAFKFVPNDFVDFHKKNPLQSYHGFNIAFIEFTKESFIYMKRLGFQVFLIAGLMHIVLCVSCFCVFPEWSKSLIAGSSVTVLGLSSLFYVISKADNFKDS